MDESKVSGATVGIDLGTAQSCVAVVVDGRARVLSLGVDKEQVASVVSYGNDGAVCGAEAVARREDSLKRTVFDVGQLIGRPWACEGVRKTCARLPFTTRAADSGEARAMPSKQVPVVVEVTGGGGEAVSLTPEMVTAGLLKHIKRGASASLGEEVENAVIAIPIGFDMTQRQAVRQAAKLAGINVLRLLSTPLAVASTYHVKHHRSGERYQVYVDIGASQASATVVCADDGIQETRSFVSAMDAGGNAFTAALVQHCAEDVRRRLGHNIFDDVKAMHRLWQACDGAKCALSHNTEAVVSVDALVADVNYTATIARETFEALNADNFQRIVNMVTAVLKQDKVSHVHDLVLIGASSAMPRLRALLAKATGQAEPTEESPDPTTGAAVGAAILSSILSGQQAPQYEDLLLLEVIPAAIGVETAGGVMATIIPANCNIPCRKVQRFSTYADNQSVLKLPVWQGPNKRVEHNRLVAAWTLEGIKPAPRGVPQIHVTFDVDADGILNITAVDKAHPDSHITTKSLYDTPTETPPATPAKSDTKAAAADAKTPLVDGK